MKMTVLWDVTPCSLVETDGRFRGALKRVLVFTRLHGASSQKTVISRNVVRFEVLTAVSMKIAVFSRNVVQAAKSVHFVEKI
jgi:hypothetical protein